MWLIYVQWNNIIQAVVNTRRVRVSVIFPNIILSKDQYSSGEVSNALDKSIQM